MFSVRSRNRLSGRLSFLFFFILIQKSIAVLFWRNDIVMMSVCLEIIIAHVNFLVSGRFYLLLSITRRGWEWVSRLWCGTLTSCSSWMSIMVVFSWHYFWAFIYKWKFKMFRIYCCLNSRRDNSLLRDGCLYCIDWSHRRLDSCLLSTCI